MSPTVFRVNSVNAFSIVSLSVVFGLIFAAIAIWRVGTPRFIAIGVTAVVLVLITIHLCAAKVRLDGDCLRVGTGLYRVAVPWQDVIGVTQVRERIKFRWRKNGIGMPGFALGWFVASDKRTVFATTGRTNDALRIRLRGNFDVVVGVIERDTFLRALQERLRPTRD